VQFQGLDENDNPIVDRNAKMPVITFTGTVKLHGTNASVCYNSQEGMWYQSRKNVITPANDNAGFAFFAESNKSSFYNIIGKIKTDNDIDPNEFTISLYGEWAGKKIQKGVAISELDKAFYIFGVKISKPQDPEFNAYWIDSSSLRDVDARIFNVNDFRSYSIDVDFNMPQLSQNKFTEITEEVEKECPIAKASGILGVGEGVVWVAKYEDSIYRFKVKGEKHSVTKVKTLVSVDVEKLASINDFIEYSVTENRFNQAIENVYGEDDLDIEKLGDFIRWFINDITSEEMDTMVKNNLEPKDVNKYISNKVREMFFKAQI
jgi:hypothetical protein